MRIAQSNVPGFLNYLAELFAATWTVLSGNMRILL